MVTVMVKAKAKAKVKAKVKAKAAGGEEAVGGALHVQSATGRVIE